MTSYKIGRRNKVSGTNRFVSETQMRSSETTRFFRIVCKISLTILVGSPSDNFNGILICPYRTVRTQTIKFSFISGVVRYLYFCFQRQGFESNVIYNTDCKLVFRFVHGHIFINGYNLCGSHIFRTHSITSANNQRCIRLTIEDIFHIEIKGIAICSRFFCPVEHCNPFHRCRNSLHKIFRREGTI